MAGSIVLICLMCVFVLHIDESFHANDILIVTFVFLTDISLIIFILISVKTKRKVYDIKLTLIPNPYRLGSIPFVLYITVKYTNLVWINLYSFGVVLFMLLMSLSIFVIAEKYPHSA